MSNKTKIEAIDLFCGVGGLTYGLNKSGILVKAGLDNDLSCKHIYENNNKTPFICGDITKYSDEDFVKLRGLVSNESLFLLTGCPPCQPFSKANRLKSDDDSRAYVINDFKRAIFSMSPDIVFMENVPLFRKSKQFTNFVKDIETLGYVVDYKVISCADYGVPQFRNRLLLLASKNLCIKLPKQTHDKNSHITLSDTIKGLSDIKAGETCKTDPLHRCMNLSDLNMKRIRASKPGGTYRDWDKSLLAGKHSRGRHPSPYSRLSWDKPSFPITTCFTGFGSGRYGHPEQDRALSLREGALLQTYPMDFDFGQKEAKEIKESGLFKIESKKFDFGKIKCMSTIARHIGNSVPPRLGEVLGTSLLNDCQPKEHNN